MEKKWTTITSIGSYRHTHPCVHVITNQRVTLCPFSQHDNRGENKDFVTRMCVCVWPVCWINREWQPGCVEKRKTWPQNHFLFCTSWSIQMYSLEWDRIYYRSRLIFLICAEKISIYKAHFAVKWGRKCGNETETRQDELAQERERTTDKEYKEREREREGRRSAQKPLCIHGGFWSCEMSSHRSQESDKLGKKLYFASRAAKSIKVMPSAYININDNRTCTRTHAHTDAQDRRNGGK